MRKQDLAVSCAAAWFALLSLPSYALEPAQTLVLDQVELRPLSMRSTEGVASPCGLEATMHASVLHENRSDKKARVRIVAADGNTNSPQELQRHLRVVLSQSEGTAPASRVAPIWIQANATLIEQGRPVAEYSFVREEDKGRLNNCKLVRNMVESLADDVASWANQPVQGTKLARNVPIQSKEPVSPVLLKSCPIGQMLSERITDKKLRLAPTHENLDEIPGRKLWMTITDMHLADELGQPIRRYQMRVQGGLVEGGKSLGDFIALRRTIRDWSACGRATRLTEELGDDIQKWLRKPSPGSKLGEEDEIDKP